MDKTILVEDFLSFVASKRGHENNDFEYLMLYNLVDYGVRNCCTSKDQLAYFLSDIIPYIAYDDVVCFIHDEYLTQNGKRIKNSKKISL